MALAAMSAILHCRYCRAHFATAHCAEASLLCFTRGRAPARSPDALPGTQLALWVWLGQISYSLYLWQEPFCADRHMRSGYLALAAVACACLSYYLIERPMLRVRERRSGRATNEISQPNLEASPTAA